MSITLSYLHGVSGLLSAPAPQTLIAPTRINSRRGFSWGDCLYCDIFMFVSLSGGHGRDRDQD